MRKYFRHILAAASGVIVFVVYVITLHPGVGFMDCGELAAVCYTFGVPHPTGYPLFLVLGFVTSHLPFSGSVIYRLNLLSAIESSAAVIITFYSAVILLQSLKLPQLKKKSTSSKKDAMSDFKLSISNVYVIAFVTALTCGLTKTWWANSTEIEVYALHGLFASIIFLYSLKVIFGLKNPSRKNWAMLFLFFGLSCANHSTTIFFIHGLIYLYYLQYKANKVFAESILVYLLLLLPGALLYIVLIYSASSHPYLNWSNPQSLSGLINHLRGSDFSQLMFSSSAGFSKNASSFFKNLPGEMAFVPGITGLLGVAYLLKCNKYLFTYLLLIIVTCLFYSFNYSIIDIQTYYLVVYYFLAFFGALGIVFLSMSIGKKESLAADGPNTIVVLLGVLSIAACIGFNFKESDRSADFVNEDITVNTLNVIEPNSVLLTYDFPFVYSASLYYQQVERLRPDVKVFNIKFLSAPWYLETIKKYYPDVYQNIQAEADEYIKTYDLEDRNHPARLTSLVKSFFDKNISKFTVNLTFDCVLSKEMSAFLGPYSVEPDGIVYRLREKGAKYDPDAGMRSLNVAFRKYEPIGYHKNKMFVSTPGVYYETAYYHYKNKNYTAAMKFLEKALEFNSSFRDAVTLKNQIEKESKGK